MFLLSGICYCCLSNDVTRLQALVDKKKVVITEATIRDALRLNDAEGVDCLPNEEIFAELACMGYEKPSTKLIFYKAFFSSQWKRVGKGFLGVETPLFEGMLVVGEFEEQGAAEEQVQNDVDNTVAQGDDTAVPEDAVHEPSIPSPTLPTPPPQQSQDLPSTSQVQHTSPQSPLSQPPPQAQPQAADFPMSLLQEALDACAALARRVEHLEYDKVAQALEIIKLKRRVKQLERGNKVKVLKLKRLKKVGTSQRIESSNDTNLKDASNQGRMIDELDRDEGVALMDDEGEKRKQKRLRLLEDEPKVQEVVDVVTTAKLITKVVTAASTTIAAAEPQVPAATITAAPVMKKRPQTKAQAQRNMMYLKSVTGFRLDYYKGMSYDDICPIFEAKFNSNIKFLLKLKEQIEEEENRAIQSINKTPAQKEANKRKLNEEVEDLKQHLEIVPVEDDDVYTEATPLERKAPIMDYAIIHFNNKPHYKIIRADVTNQLYLILLVERRYPLLRFTLDQMLNAVRLRVEEQSEMSLELLRFTRQQHQEGQLE
nr:hypothetical protein [Tanacetum cinerariifolium]